MAPAVPIAVAATLIFSLSTIPAFIIVDVLLPIAHGFAMFALAVAPMLFLCALLMAHKKTMLIGYFSALLFASAGQFQSEMTYDPVGLINTSIAAVIAAAAAMVLWAILAPQTPEAARRRFVRAAHRALARIVAPRPLTRIAEFETAMTERRRGRFREFRSGWHPWSAGSALIYWSMKKRARTVGEGGMHEFLKDLQTATAPRGTRSARSARCC
jgi:hypothetical protein